MSEPIDELRARYARLDAEYRKAGDQLKQLLARGPRNSKEIDAVMAMLRDLYEEIERVQEQLRALQGRP